MKRRFVAFIILLFLMWVTLSGCSQLKDISVSNSQSAAQVLTGANNTEPGVGAEKLEGYNENKYDVKLSNQRSTDISQTDATKVLLSDLEIKIDGQGAVEKNGVVIINDGGTYEISGSISDGRVVVDAADCEVILILNGVDITCPYGSSLYIYKAAKVTLHVLEGTENFLKDGSVYTYEDTYSSETDGEPDACIYSKEDLIIQGTGNLTVEAVYKNGITSKDSLYIYDVNLNVNAVKNGINGKDLNSMESAHITVECGEDALRSTNTDNSDVGKIEISNSELNLTAGEDGIQAESSLIVMNSNVNIETGGGHGASASADISKKGVKSGGDMTLTGSKFNLDCADDAVHSNSNIMVLSGEFVISTADDAFHADGNLNVEGGGINIKSSYEGMEAANIDVSGGDIYIVSNDDGFNAAGGDGSGFGGFGPRDNFNMNEDKYSLKISGGRIDINAGGDALDSNGSLEITGGTVSVASIGNGDCALDCDAGISVTGGTLLAIDTGAMTQTPGGGGQNTIAIGFGKTLPKGTYVSIFNDSQSFVFCLKENAATLTFSSEELKTGSTYNISYGGSYSGVSNSGICSDGSYTGGTILSELTITDGLNTVGTIGSGRGMRGGAFGGGFRREGGRPPVMG